MEFAEILELLEKDLSELEKMELEEIEEIELLEIEDVELFGNTRNRTIWNRKYKRRRERKWN